jgi:hypothetical protein
MDLTFNPERAANCSCVNPAVSRNSRNNAPNEP